MARFLKRKTGLSLSVLFFWGVYFFFFPFLHYHPEAVHQHGGESFSHHHQGHFHSQELEALAHAWNFHPDNHEQDEKHHHSHSSPEHDTDHIGIDFNNAGLKSNKEVRFPQCKAETSSPCPQQTIFIQVKRPPSFKQIPEAASYLFRQRSPPALLGV